MTKEELEQLLEDDLRRYPNGRPTLKDRLISNESWWLYQTVRRIRLMEYHCDKGVLHHMAYLYNWFCYKRLSLKLHITLFPGTFQGGFRIYHCGDFTHIGPNCRIGKNCTILSGVVFGNKHEEGSEELTTVGDNCYFGLGARILGAVNIGNNVTIGANSVVTKDIPDNAIVGGVPAKILKIKQ